MCQILGYDDYLRILIKREKGNLEILFHYPYKHPRICWSQFDDIRQSLAILDFSKLFKSQTHLFVETNSFSLRLCLKYQGNLIFTMIYPNLSRIIITDNEHFLRIFREPKMNIVVQIFRLLYLQPTEIRIFYYFMSWNHFVGTDWDYLAIMLNLIYHNTKSIKLSEIFVSKSIILSSKIQWLVFSRDFKEDFLMLSCKIVVYLINFCDKTGFWDWKLSKFKVFRTMLSLNYLQKNFLFGKPIASLNFNPSTM